MEDEEEASPLDNIQRQYSAVSSREDKDEPRKTQAQRLWEFELWTNEKTLKDLEYSQRRTEKQQRKRDRKRNRRYRRWKMLYLPAVLGMVGGTFLTLTATLQGLGVGTFIWDIRHVIMVIGPVIIAGGFVCLMLAAGCTFRHENEDRKTPKPPGDFISLLGFRTDEFQSRRSTVPHSFSVDTEDMPLPVDLDPNRNYVLSKGGDIGSPRRPLRSVSGGSGNSVFLMSQTSYSSTASWVKSLTVTNQQQRGHLTRQHSDSNLLTSRSHGDTNSLDRWSRSDLKNCVTRSERRQTTCRSQCDLHVICTRSLTSSGYYSCASDTTSVNLEPRRISTRRGCTRRGSSPVYSSSGRVHSTLCSVSAYGCGARSRSPAKRVHVHQGTSLHTANSRRHYGSASSEKQVFLDSVKTGAASVNSRRHYGSASSEKQVFFDIVKTGVASVNSLNTRSIFQQHQSAIENINAPVHHLNAQRYSENRSSRRPMPPKHVSPTGQVENSRLLGKQYLEQDRGRQIDNKIDRPLANAVFIPNALPTHTYVSGEYSGNQRASANKATEHLDPVDAWSTEVTKKKRMSNQEMLVLRSGEYCPVSSTTYDVYAEVHHVYPQTNNETKVVRELPSAS